MDEKNISVMPDSVDKMVDSFAESRTITCMCYDSQLRTGNLDACGKGKNSTMQTMDRRKPYFIWFITRTTDIIGNQCLRWKNTLERECLKEGFLDTIISTIITPGHHLIGFLESNIDIRIFFQRVKHATDNSKNEL